MWRRWRQDEWFWRHRWCGEVKRSASHLRRAHLILWQEACCRRAIEGVGVVRRGDASPGAGDSDNDYCGDADGLVQLAHHLLSPSVHLRCVVASPMADEASIGQSASAEASTAAASTIAGLCGRSEVSIVAGQEASSAIIVEAMREDTDAPLFVACGGGLTAIAEAWQQEPRIADRSTLVWIGGREHADLAPAPPDDPPVEYNTGIDFAASQVVFNKSDLHVWQVPRDAYRQVIATMRSPALSRAYAATRSSRSPSLYAKLELRGSRRSSSARSGSI